MLRVVVSAAVCPTAICAGAEICRLRSALGRATCVNAESTPTGVAPSTDW